MRNLLGLAFAFLCPLPALASPCQAFVDAWPGDVQVAELGKIASAAPVVEISYVAHSTFRIETPEGVAIATDFFGAAGGDTPDVVTMNHAHETHYTDFPDPAIPHVLRGWKTGGRA
ncbi:MAG: MBL fold metallo-hydrolase, partial [Pseudomonadota bacterium]